MYVKELIQYVGTKTLIKVDISNLCLEEDLFILSSKLYARANNETIDTYETIKQAKNILHVFYNSIDDKFSEIYLNLEDAYVPQYFTKKSEKYDTYKLINLTDYILPIENYIKDLIDDNKAILIKIKENDRRYKFEYLFSKLGLKNKLDKVSNRASFIVTKEFYYDMKVKDLGLKSDLSFDFESLCDKAYEIYFK